MSEKYRADSADGSAVVVKKEGNYGTKILLVLLAIVVVALVGFLAASWLPRWWAQYVGGIIDGRVSVGSMLGIAAGVVFTFLPLIVLRRVFSLHASAASRVFALIGGALLAAPTVMTIAINYTDGSNSALRAAQRTMDVDSPGFRGGTMIGAVIGVGLALFWWYGMIQRARRRKQKYQHELEVEQLKVDKRKQAEELERRNQDAKEAEQRAAAEKEAAAKLAERKASTDTTE